MISLGNVDFQINPFPSILNRLPAIKRKSWRDLSIRKSRTIFTIITIALGVSALSMFAVVPMVNEQMEEEIEKTNMYDLSIVVSDVPLNETNIRELEELENIIHVEPRTMFFTRIYTGERRTSAMFVGVDDFNDQKVDLITKESGELPGPMELMIDPGNIRNFVYTGSAGDSVRIIDYSGAELELPITGEARNFVYTSSTNDGVAVFYASVETVRQIGNLSGYNVLKFDLETSTREAAEGSIEDIRTYLTNSTNTTGFVTMPEIREEGNYPGKEGIKRTAVMFYIISLIALFCSLVLISSTMHSIISEQTREIAQMKAVGATGGQVVRSYLTTSFFIGLIGSIGGSLLGIIWADGLGGFVADLYGLPDRFLWHPPVFLASIFIGIGATILASVPALIASLKITVREGLESKDITATFGKSALDRTLLRLKNLPRNMVLGLRNIARNKGRSVATILQVTVAVMVLLGVLSFSHTMGEIVVREWNYQTYDLQVWGREASGVPLTEEQEITLENIEGVADAEPFITTEYQLGTTEMLVRGLKHNTFAYDHRETITKGRWFTAEDSGTRAMVMIMARTLADLKEIEVGDTISFSTPMGAMEFRIIGIDKGLSRNGMAVYIPFTTAQEIRQSDNEVSGFNVRTITQDQNVIDRTATLIEDTMVEQGFVVNSQIHYVMKQNNVRSNQETINLLFIVGMLIVFITMIGLMNTLTMNILERTREIGIMRCIGGGSRDIKRVFAFEGIIITLSGWTLGVPAGFLLGWGISKMVADQLHIKVSLSEFEFPMLFVLLSLVVTFFLRARH